MRLSVNELALRVADRILFQDLTVHWEGAQFVTIIGPSGSGKSTFLSAIIGWHRPHLGSIEIEQQGSTWLVPQNAPLLESRTVLENLEVAMLARNSQDEELGDLNQVLQTFRLAHVMNSRAKVLSGGERQRVALARAALRKPGILLADEVTAGLDPQGVQFVSEALRELAKESLVIVATHDERVWRQSDFVLDLAKVCA